MGLGDVSGNGKRLQSKEGVIISMIPFDLGALLSSSNPKRSCFFCLKRYPPVN